MSPILVLSVHVVLVHRVLVGESALDLADVVVQFLASFLVDRGAHRPDHAEQEPHLDHALVVLLVVWVDLWVAKSYIYILLGIPYMFILFIHFNLFNQT